MRERIRLLVLRIIMMLAAGDYDQIFALTRGVRMTSEEIRRAINDYGRRLIPPPDRGYEVLDIIKVNNISLDQYSVRMPLWTEEEGRSDLTIELTVKANGENMEVALDDIHVL